MEIDSTLSWLVLAISAIGFILASLEEAALNSVRRERVQSLVGQDLPGAMTLDRLHSTPLGPAGSFTFLKVVFLALALLFGSALAIDRWKVDSIQFAVVTILALGAVGTVYLISRAVAAVYGERFALRTAAMVLGVSTSLRFILVVDSFVTGRVLMRYRGEQGANGGNGSAASGGLSVEGEGEPLDEREVRMIRGVVQLDQTTAREIMVPRVDILAVEIGTPIRELTREMVDSGHSRLPVYEESLDHVVGIAYSRDLLAHLSTGGESKAVVTTDLIRSPMFIPESKNLVELLTEFQERRLHIAIVVDEYGGVSGLVTIEDLLEEIVGEIMDEFEVGELQIEQVEEGEFLLDARVSIDQLNDLVGTKIESDGFDTVGGFVYDRLGKIPSLGDSVDYDGLKIEVVSTVGRRLKRLRVQLTDMSSS